MTKTLRLFPESMFPERYKPEFTLIPNVVLPTIISYADVPLNSGRSGIHRIGAREVIAREVIYPDRETVVSGLYRSGNMLSGNRRRADLPFLNTLICKGGPVNYWQ